MESNNVVISVWKATSVNTFDLKTLRVSRRELLWARWSSNPIAENIDYHLSQTCNPSKKGPQAGPNEREASKKRLVWYGKGILRIIAFLKGLPEL